MHKNLLYILLIVYCFCISCKDDRTQADRKIGELIQTGDSLYQAKDKEEALLIYKQAERLLSETTASHLKAQVYNALGRLNQDNFNPALAKEYYERALNAQSADVTDSVESLVNLTGIYYYYNRTDSMQWCLNRQSGFYKKVDSASQMKMVFNSGAMLKELVNNSEAMNLHIIRALRTASWQTRMEDWKMFHPLYDQKGNLMLNDSICRLAAEIPELPRRANLHYLLYREAVRYKKYPLAADLMSRFIADADSFFTLVSRTNIQSLQQRYNESEWQRKNAEVRSRWYATILVALLSLVLLSLFYYFSIRWYRRKKEKELLAYRQDVALLQQRIEALETKVEEDYEELEEKERLQEELIGLQQEKQRKEIRIRQLETIFKAKDISVAVADVEAIQSFRNILEKEQYVPATDRGRLQHWLNMACHGFADRLKQQYPLLSERDKDVCYLKALGLDNEIIARILEVQVRSVDRYISRVCEKLGFAKGNKDDFALFIKRFKEEE